MKSIASLRQRAKISQNSVQSQSKDQSPNDQWTRLVGSAALARGHLRMRIAEIDRILGGTGFIGIETLLAWRRADLMHCES
jgi:hypothetical protein